MFRFNGSRWLMQWAAAWGKRKPRHRRAPRARPRLEPLEDRLTPAIDTWAGNADVAQNWSDARNWSNGVPNNGDDLVFPALPPGSPTSNTNDLTGLSVHSITFNGTGYAVGGNTIDLTGSLSDQQTTPSNDGSTDDTVTLGINLPNDITVNGPSGFNAFALDSAISGPGGMTVTGSGTVSLGGTAGANSYTGTTQVNGGTLNLDKATAVAGPLVVGDGTGNGFVVAQANVSNATDPGVPVTVNRFASFGVGQSGAEVQDTIGSLTLNAGTVDLEGPPPGGRVQGTILTLGGDVTVNPGTNGFTSSTMLTDTQGFLSLGSAPRTFDVTSGASLGVFVPIDGTVAATLTKSGPGTLVLGVDSTYLGQTVLGDGVTEIKSPMALGSPTAGSIVSNGATLAVVGFQNFNGSGISGVANIPEPLTLNGPGFQGSLPSDLVGTPGEHAALVSTFQVQAVDPPNSWSGPITLNADSAIETDAPLTISGLISGPGGLTALGPSSLALAGSTANTYAGTTNVSGGILILQTPSGVVAVPGSLVIGDGASGSDSISSSGPKIVLLQNNEQIADNAPVLVNSDGQLNVNGFTETIGSLAGAGLVILDSSGSSPGQQGPPVTPGTLITGVNSIATAFAGVISGSGGSVVKVGGGVFILTGANTYSGTTTVNDGTLLVDGSQPSSMVVVNAGGTLGGRGTVGPTAVNPGGVVAPGDSPGVLSVQGGIGFGPGSVLFAEINGPAAGSGYDQLRVAGTVSLNNPTLRLALGFAPAPGQDFVLIANDGAGTIGGTFAGAPEDALVAHGATFFDISYAGGRGRDVDLLSQSRGDLFVRGLFADFNAPSTRGTRAPFEAQVDGGQGRLAAAQSFLMSPPRLLGEVNLFYTVFGQPDDGLKGRYLSQLLSGVPAGQVLLNFLTSRSFRRLHRGNQAFVRALFTGLLGHPPGKHDLLGHHTMAFYLAELNAGTVSRANLVQRLLSSDEVYAAAVTQNFVTLLGTVPTPAQQQALSAQLVAGTLAPDALSELLVTQEAYVDFFVARVTAGLVPGVVLTHA